MKFMTGFMVLNHLYIYLYPWRLVPPGNFPLGDCHGRKVYRLPSLNTPPLFHPNHTFEGPLPNIFPLNPCLGCQLSSPHSISFSLAPEEFFTNLSSCILSTWSDHLKVFLLTHLWNHIPCLFLSDIQLLFISVGMPWNNTTCGLRMDGGSLDTFSFG